MRHRTPLVVALVLVVGGLAAAGSAMGHTADQTANNQYQITDQGVLTGYGGPVVNPLGGHVENPATGENVFVPTVDASVETGPNNENHHHAGNAVEYSIHVNGTSAEGDDISRIEASVNYEKQDLDPRGPDDNVWTADVDCYLFGPDGDLLDESEGSDNGEISTGGLDLPAGSYAVLLVARHGVAPYDTTITVTD